MGSTYLPTTSGRKERQVSRQLQYHDPCCGDVGSTNGPVELEEGLQLSLGVSRRASWRKQVQSNKVILAETPTVGKLWGEKEAGQCD